MKTMLTSFGVDQVVTSTPEAGYQRGFSIFAGMPPVDMRSVLTGFVPEYSLLILSEKLIFDEQSFEFLTERQANSPFKTIGHTLELLRREGFLELMDYGSVLAGNGDLLQRMTDNDLRSIDQWIETLGDSLQTWRAFMERIEPRQFADTDRAEQTHAIHVLYNNLGPIYFSEQVYDEQDFSDWDREIIFRTLKSYLRYVNANLILSNEFDAGLHDWEDYLPFYRQKFLAVGQDSPGVAARAEASHQLFDIAFPELAIRTPEHLLRILQHKRVNELRALIDEAARGRTVFDEQFARSVFREIIGAERKLARQRRLMGYITAPVGFIPLVGNFAQLLLQEAAGTILERKLTKKYRWFYMLSDIAYKNRPVNG